MYRVTTESGRVGHIAGSVFDGAEGRIVTTACGKTYPEADLRVVYDLDDCNACDKKFFNLVDEAVDVMPDDKKAKSYNKKLAAEAEKAAAADEEVNLAATEVVEEDTK
jgi:hypothetical protein